MLESSNRLGAIENTKEVTRWAFDAKKGDVSDIKNIDNKYFVVAVLKGIHEEGYTPVSEVSAMIENVLYSQKAAQKKAEEVAEKIAGLADMQAIADALGTTVSTQEGVVFTSNSYQSLDPKFVGSASVAEEGKISAPVAGNIGVYVYKVTGRETGASFTEEDAKNRADQQSYFAAQMLIPTMMEDADVKDNRARFF
jgi:peptidyl-prolyl cis-trans isomerase D